MKKACSRYEAFAEKLRKEFNLPDNCVSDQTFRNAMEFFESNDLFVVTDKMIQYRKANDKWPMTPSRRTSTTGNRDKKSSCEDVGALTNSVIEAFKTLSAVADKLTVVSNSLINIIAKTSTDIAVLSRRIEDFHRDMTK